MTVLACNAGSSLGAAHLAAIRSTVAQTVRIKTPCSLEGLSLLEKRMRIPLNEMALLVSDLDPASIGEACDLTMTLLAEAGAPVAASAVEGGLSVAPYVRWWLGEAFSLCPEISLEQRKCAMNALYPARREAVA